MGILARCRQSPVTSLVLILLAMVFAATTGLSDGTSRDILNRQREWGLILPLQWITHHQASSDVWLPGLEGPFDLWDGQWWRIPISTLHHAGFLHLFLNSLFVATFGHLLECVWGSWKYGVFLIAAAFVVPLPEYVSGIWPMGFSGVACGIFGVLLALRPVNSALQQEISSVQIGLVLAALLLCVLLTVLNVVAIANVSHFVGLGYGYVTGLLFGPQPQCPLWGRCAMVVAHLGLIIPYRYAVSPEDNGVYLWYLAAVGEEGEPRKLFDPEHLRRAVQQSPDLATVWKLLAEHELRFGRELDAWKNLVNGLVYSPADERLWEMSRRLWRRLAVSLDRTAAISIVQEALGEEANSWMQQVRRSYPPDVLIAPDQPPPELPEAPEQRPVWTSSVAERWWRTDSVRRLPFDPGDPHSAVEGRLL